MHFAVLVITEEQPSHENPEPVDEALEGYGDGKEWDWYVIGGHWTGLFNPYPGDIIPLEQLTAEHLAKFHAVLPSGYGWYSSERYVPWEKEIGAKFQKQDLPPLEWLKSLGGWATVVDCHN